MAAAAIGLAGTGANIVGQIKSGNAKKAQLREINRQNREDAVDVLQQGREEAELFTIAANRQLATARAQVSASGVSIAGSAEDALAEASRNIAADALKIKDLAKRKAAALRRGARSAAESIGAVTAANVLGAFGTGFSGLATFGERGGFKKLGID